MNFMQQLLFDSDSMSYDERAYALAKMQDGPVQRLRWLAAFHPDSSIRRAAFNASGVSIGAATFVSIGMVILDDYQNIVKIGKRGSIGNYVSIMAATSPNDSVLKDHPELRGAIKVAPVTIGDDCWIGTGSIIMPGVTIGDKAVVGAGAIVTKDIPPLGVAHGVPARLQKTLSEVQV